MHAARLHESCALPGHDAMRAVTRCVPPCQVRLPAQPGDGVGATPHPRVEGAPPPLAAALPPPPPPPFQLQGPAL